MNSAELIVQTLKLEPHPEGGRFREVYRSPLTIETPRGARSAATHIYYLLPAGAVSLLHRVTSDEWWHFHAGDPVELLLIDESKPAGQRARVVRLGPDVCAGDMPSVLVPAGVWQGTRVMRSMPGNPEHGYALCGCTVVPGFEFDDFEMATRAAMLELAPERADEIADLTPTG